MKKRLTFSLLTLVCIFSLSAFIVDDDPFVALLKKLDEFAKKYPVEKVYLHLDKPYYAVGDDIWFKAYVTDSRTAAPTTISGIIYVELINERDSIVRQLKLQLLGGLSNGDFQLTDSLSEGNYRIRAYTQWMRNSDPRFFFDKTIKVGNSWANKVFTKTNYLLSENVLKGSIQFTTKDGTPYANAEVVYQVELAGKNLPNGKGTTNSSGTVNLSIPNSQLTSAGGRIFATITMKDGQKISKILPIKAMGLPIDVQFLPEGGSLIEGLPCKVAVKAINGNGLGENVKGEVVDNTGAEVLTFETTYLGMGSFVLNPQEGKTYTAKLKAANGTEKSFGLPLPKKSGYQLAVNNLDTAKIAIKVLLTADLLNKEELNLIAQSNGKVFFTTKLATTKQIATLVVPKREFPTGIVQLTLFANSLPVSERMIFVRNELDRIGVILSNLKPAYGKKENVELNLSATNNDKSVQGSFSIAITNTDIVSPDPDNESNILTGLLLTPNLMGYIEKPNHYFLNDGPQERGELDNLMLAQGWRKIDWKEVTDSKLTPPSFTAEKGMSISGTVTAKNKKPVEKGKITLLSSSKSRFIATAETDENGHFSFDDTVFGDSLRFVIQASTKENKKDVNIKLDRVPEQMVTKNKNTGDIELNVNSAMLKYLDKSDDYFEDQLSKGFLNRTNQLKTVNIVQKVKKEDSASPNSKNLNGRGNANYIVTEKELENTPSLAIYLSQGRIMGVSTHKDPETGSTYALLTRPRPADLVSNTMPIMGIYLDGVMLRDFPLEDLDIGEIESIEAITDVSLSAIYGLDGYNGVLVITTKQGKGRKMSEIYAPGLVTFSPKGYDYPRQFYSPKYDVKADDKPDLRTTVYWNPNVVTDATGKAKLNYYNTNQAGNYRIVIEGIDADGNLARNIFSYKVN